METIAKLTLFRRKLAVYGTERPSRGAGAARRSLQGVARSASNPPLQFPLADLGKGEGFAMVSLWSDRVSHLSRRLPPLFHVIDNCMNSIRRCAQFDRPCDVFSRQLILT